MWVVWSYTCLFPKPGSPRGLRTVWKCEIQIITNTLEHTKHRNGKYKLQSVTNCGKGQMLRGQLHNVSRVWLLQHRSYPNIHLETERCQVQNMKNGTKDLFGHGKGNVQYVNVEAFSESSDLSLSSGNTIFNKQPNIGIWDKEMLPGVKR